MNLVTKTTGMEDVTTARQRKNGTTMWFDEELNEYYMIYPYSGYARRKNRWGYTYQLNDKREIKQTFIYTNRFGEPVDVTWMRYERVLDYDVAALLALVIRGYVARRSRMTKDTVQLLEWTR